MCGGSRLKKENETVVVAQETELSQVVSGQSYGRIPRLCSWLCRSGRPPLAFSFRRPDASGGLSSLPPDLWLA